MERCMTIWLVEMELQGTVGQFQEMLTSFF